MNQFIQFIVGNSWLLIPILFGIFNLGVRAQQKAKEQKVKRDTISELNRRKSEALRTGRTVEEPLIVFDQDAAKPSAADDRNSRIEALRKQRMEQLRAMREKRAGGAAKTPAQTSAGVPARTRTQSPLRAQPGANPRRAGSPSRVQPPSAAPRTAQQTSRATPAQAARTPSPIARSAKPKPAPRTPVGSPSQRSGKPAVAAQRRSKPKAAPALADFEPQVAVNPPSSSAGQAGTAPGGVKQMLHDRKRTRQAMVLREVLSAPVSLRSEDSGPGSMPF